MERDVDTSTVALVRCEDYDEAAVHEAVGRALDLLGGAPRFARDGEHVMLKPNLLVGSAPEDVVTTHPSVFAAVARHLAAAGARLSYGDSPAFGSTRSAARKSGLAATEEALGIVRADFSECRTVSFPEGRLIKQFDIAAPVLDADALVSLPKLKTHALMRMTGAVKNQFGCISGVRKGEFHARMPDAERFAQMLVDLTRLLRPRLYIMDGVVGMEGNGPRGGDPRRLHVLLASEDPVALDAVVCRIVHLDPRLVGTVSWGEEWGLGTAANIHLVGDPVETFSTPDFAVNRSRGSTTGGQGWKGRLARDRLVPRPVIDAALCTACGTCVDMCPVAPKAVDFPDGVRTRGSNGRRTVPSHDYGRCIRCYCCQEVCPEKAIYVKTPTLGRLIHR